MADFYVSVAYHIGIIRQSKEMTVDKNKKPPTREMQMAYNLKVTKYIFCINIAITYAYLSKKQSQGFETILEQPFLLIIKH